MDDKSYKKQNYWLTSLDTALLHLRNTELLSQRIRDRANRTLGNSIISRPMSPPYLVFVYSARFSITSQIKSPNMPLIRLVPA